MVCMVCIVYGMLYVYSMYGMSMCVLYCHVATIILCFYCVFSSFLLFSSILLTLISRDRCFCCSTCPIRTMTANWLIT